MLPRLRMKHLSLNNYSRNVRLTDQKTEIRLNFIFKKLFGCESLLCDEFSTINKIFILIMYNYFSYLELVYQLSWVFCYTTISILTKNLP